MNQQNAKEDMQDSGHGGRFLGMRQWVGMGRIHVGVIGTSRRAALYFRRIPVDLRHAVRIAGLADPDDAQRATFEDLLCDGDQPRHFTSGAQMLADLDLDAVVIASPNKFHADDAERALSSGITTLLEKPVAVSVPECRRLWAAQRASSADNMLVGFVLRYAPFYCRVKEIIDSGRIGEILAIQADESLGTAQTMAFFRGWRRYDEIAGSFILEKCCHDFDMLNWLVGARVERVFSVGHRTHLISDTPASRRFGRYETMNRPEHSADYGDNKIKEAFFTPIDGSPYEIPADFPDHQAVTLDYTNGTICSFTVCMAQPRTTRSLKVFGTNGSLEGDIARSRITVFQPHSTGDGHDVEQITVEHDSSGHNGADSVIGDAFWRIAAGGRSDEAGAGLREGIEAVLVSLAAEQSRRTLQPVDMSTLRRDVYGSTADQLSERA